MGPARLDWQDVPLAHAVDTLAVPIGLDGLGDATCCSMGMRIFWPNPRWRSTSN
jgi:diaminopimelate epimerase